MKIICIDSVESTNSYVAARAGELEHLTLVMAHSQTAGRGQRGNHWESEPGKNLTCSVLLRIDDFPAAAQFSISEAVALAVCDTLREFSVSAKVKWPNDIYVGNRKICGILIEHSVMGRGIMHSIAGVGLNINQTHFISDAPNPVSMASLVGHGLEIMEVAEVFMTTLQKRLTTGSALLHDEFKSHLWRGDGGYHPFRDRENGDIFYAAIDDVEPSGMLVLRKDDDTMGRYAFKEVEFLLKPPAGA